MKKTKKEKVIAVLDDAPYYTSRETANLAGCSRSYVQYLAKHLDLPIQHGCRRLSDIDKARIIRLSRMGLDVPTIADRVKCAETTVSRWRKECGIGRFRHVDRATYDVLKIQIARAFLVEGLRTKQVMLRYNVTRGTVTGIVFRARRMGWDLSAREREREAA